MSDLLHTLFGEGKDLSTFQMGCRAFVMFFITLALIRLAGMRAFGQKSAFDSIIVIMLGAILSRAVTGASAFVGTIVAGAVLALVHRLLAMISVYSDVIGFMVKGRKTILFRNGKLLKKNMLITSISNKDLLEEVRLELNESTLDNVKEIFMERSGKISVVKKDNINKLTK
ncbi:MAG: DUF421 domain-containing protein [Chitinophagaceae bacterium]|nr:DUF421 domain-containing protein [Chitinophagaceae bacterium]